MGGKKGTKALSTHACADLNPERLKYEMVFVKGEQPGYTDLEPTRKFIEKEGKA
jgi:hypothetical protein